MEAAFARGQRAGLLSDYAIRDKREGHKGAVSFVNKTAALFLSRGEDQSGADRINAGPDKGGVMKAQQSIPKDIDEYIAGFPPEIRVILENLRKTIREAVPEAEEKISYQMPTFTLKGNLVHFAAFKKHIGFYPLPTGIEKFKKELSVYQGGKGSVQFPLDKPIPLDLIGKIVKFRVKENLQAAAKVKKK